MHSDSLSIQGEPFARALARVNLAAIQRNVRRLRSELAGSSELCAVVKADAYGHGAVPCAHAAIAGGATLLAVASPPEALELRTAGIDAPILIMGSIDERELDAACAAGAEVVAWSEGFVARLGARGRARVHVKLDTGMGRLGTRDPLEADRVLAAVDAHPALTAVGLMTHFATADERTDKFFGEQLDRFRRWVDATRARRPGLVAHAANSAATLRDPASHFDMVRCGVAIYGLDPFGVDPAARGLEPALELSSTVADVKACATGESVGYGRRFVAAADTQIASAPIGYGDGVRRGLGGRADVLVGGRRRPLAGTISMDNITVDVGLASGVKAGDPVVLIGEQAGERVTAEELARTLGTINYEITCGLLPRTVRRHHNDGAAAGRLT